VIDPYEVEIREYTADELDDAIAWTEIEVADMSKDGATYDLESLKINLNMLKSEKDRRAARALAARR
jgi:hypothetical protein